MRPVRVFAVLSLALLLPAAARGWIYTEHRAIAARGIEALPPAQRAELDRLWGEAREGHTPRLCAAPAEGGLALKPECIDLASWPAIAGDHSCSPENMLAIILESGWILNVAGVVARTEAAFGKARSESDRRNAQVIGDLGLERADDEYSTRAVAGNAHFMLPRSGSDPKQYAVESLSVGAEPNAMALYILFHAAALQAAAKVADGEAWASDRAASLRLVLALEMFGVHFLEDAFAAGHIAGSWGTVAERKGTHDYYNEHGLDTESWKREPMVVFGDGHIREEDLHRAGAAVALSLGEVLETAKAGSAANVAARQIVVPPDVADGSFSVCTATRMPDWVIPESVLPRVAEIVSSAPIPFRGPGFASLPRMRAEIGPFLGVASGFEAQSADGGFAPGKGGGVLGSLDVGVRAGLGLDALLGDAGDGLIFLQAGIAMESRSTGGCEPDCPVDPLLEQFVPGVPARTGLAFRLRLPFWLIPGDLIVAAPILAFTNPTLLKKMGITAADGGLIPWQTKISTPVGWLQFVAGREVGVNLFGYLGDKNAFLVATGRNADNRPVYEPVAIKSVEWSFPLVELRPFREYGTRYAFATYLQIGAGFDTPIDAQSLIPGAPVPELKTRYFGFLRIFFDGRRYF